MFSFYNNWIIYCEEFRFFSINLISFLDVIIFYNILVSFYNDFKFKMGDKGREIIKLFYFECGFFFDWLVLIEG